MSFLQPNLGDIVLGIKLAHTTWSIWYHEDLRADAQYIDFLDDVRRFGQILERLEGVLTRTDGLEICPSPTNNKAPSKRLSKGLNCEREVLGDFVRTLRGCQKLLDDNKKYLNNSPTFLENVQWHFSTQDRATSLRNRLQFHSLKVSLILETLNTARLADVRDNIERILDRLSKDFRLPSVPESLENRYVEALEDGKPTTFTTLEDFPLNDGLDAAVFHYNQGTVKFTQAKALGVFFPGGDHFNSLIKSRWIFGKLLRSSQLRNAGPSSLWVLSLTSLLKRM